MKMSMLPSARLYDVGVGVCAIHGPQMGWIVTGKPLTIINVLPSATMGDIVLASCGHFGTIVSGNPTKIDTIAPGARIMDTFVGVFSGTIVSGSINTLS